MLPIVLPVLTRTTTRTTRTTSRTTRTLQITSPPWRAVYVYGSDGPGGGSTASSTTLQLLLLQLSVLLQLPFPPAQKTYTILAITRRLWAAKPFKTKRLAPRSLPVPASMVYKDSLEPSHKLLGAYPGVFSTDRPRQTAWRQV